MEWLGMPVEIKPAFNSETGARDIDDGWVHCVGTVTAVCGEYLTVQIKAGPEVEFHCGRIKMRVRE